MSLTLSVEGNVVSGILAVVFVAVSLFTSIMKAKKRQQKNNQSDSTTIPQEKVNTSSQPRSYNEIMAEIRAEKEKREMRRLDDKNPDGVIDRVEPSISTSNKTAYDAVQKARLAREKRVEEMRLANLNVSTNPSLDEDDDDDDPYVSPFAAKTTLTANSTLSFSPLKANVSNEHSHATGTFRKEYVPTSGSLNVEPTEGCEDHYNFRFVELDSAFDEFDVENSELSPLQAIIALGNVLDVPVSKSERQNNLWKK